MIEQSIAKDNKILFCCATSKMVLSFRTELIKKFQDEGYHVSVVTFDDAYSKQILDLGVDFYCVDDNNRGLNPLKILTLKNRYYKIIKRVKPDVVFTFMMKPNIYGVIAAKKAGVKRIYSMVEGLGDVFIYDTLKWKLIRLFVTNGYKKSFKAVDKVFFLNEEDKGEFIKRKLIQESKCERINGIGVNLSKYEYKPLKHANKFLMVARMIKAKGILEYCKAARIVKTKYNDVTFGYLGEESTVKLADIQEYIDDGSIVYYGVTDDVRPFLEDCSVFVLPSYYREGLPMSIMEAESVGRAIITTDNVGCRDTVENGKNGFLVPTKNVDELVEKIEFFVLNPQKTIEMGENSRILAEQKFDSKKINEIVFSTIKNSLQG